MVQLAWISAFGLTKKVSGFRHFQVFGRLDFGIVLNNFLFFLQDDCIKQLQKQFKDAENVLVSSGMILNEFFIKWVYPRNFFYKHPKISNSCD